MAPIMDEEGVERDWSEDEVNEDSEVVEDEVVSVDSWLTFKHRQRSTFRDHVYNCMIYTLT